MNNIKIKLDFLISYLIILFPFFMIIGSSFLNLFSIIMSLYAFTYYKNFKKLILSDEKIFLIIFCFFMFIFPYNSIAFEKSLLKFISFFRYIFMFFGLIIFFNNINNKKLLSKTKKIYLILLVIISFDVLKEYFTGKNLFGYTTDYTGRIASFTNDELIIGYIFAFLSLFSFGIFKFTTNKFYIFFLFFIVIISFLIGERSNFLKLTSLLSVLSVFHYLLINKFSYLQLFKSFMLVILFSGLFLTVMKNTDQAKKLYNIDLSINNNNSYDNYLLKNFYDSKHAPHYIAAIKISLKYPFFGIGINNFKIESEKKEYEDKKLKYFKNRSSTHPHQIYLEILSEVGILGFVYFLIIFIWSTVKAASLYFETRNLQLLGHLMLHIFFIFPILPSGSFFGTIYGLPFWFNFSILIFLIKETKIKALLKNPQQKI